MMIGGALLFFLGRDWVDAGALNEGELLSVPTPLAELGLGAVPAPGRWRLLLVCGQPAKDDCLSAAALIESIPILLGKDAPRLVLVAVTPESVRLPESLSAWRHTEASLTHLSRQLAKRNLIINPYLNYALIADPGGHTVLLYRRAKIGSPLLNDLKRMLRLSRIG